MRTLKVPHYNTKKKCLCPLGHSPSFFFFDLLWYIWCIHIVVLTQSQFGRNPVLFCWRDQISIWLIRSGNSNQLSIKPSKSPSGMLQVMWLIWLSGYGLLSHQNLILKHYKLLPMVLLLYRGTVSVFYSPSRQCSRYLSQTGNYKAVYYYYYEILIVT